MAVFLVPVYDASVKEKNSLRVKLITCWSERKRHIFDESEGERNNKPQSDSQTNNENKRSSFLHKIFMCILKYMFDVQSYKDSEPIRKLDKLISTV